jgi:hypothetical protein
VIVGRNSNAKTAEYRLIDTTTGDAANAPPGGQLSLDAAGTQ